MRSITHIAKRGINGVSVNGVKKIVNVCERLCEKLCKPKTPKIQAIFKKSDLDKAYAGIYNDNEIINNEFATSKPDGTIETVYKPKEGLRYFATQLKDYGRKR